MQTPTLSKQQQRATLSSKSGKKKPEARIRNVYAQPYKAYWPVLPHGFGEELEDLLEKALRPARKTKLKTLKAGDPKIHKDENLREESELSIGQSEQQKQLWSFIVRGINEVTRGLEKGTVACVLLSEDANPQQMVSHIPRMCAITGVPVIVLDFLRNVTQQSLGFSCVALGFKKEAMTDIENHFHPVCTKIQQLAESLPPPDPQLPILHIDFESEDATKKPVSETSHCSKYEKPADLHLHRTSRKERAFIPSLSDPVKQASDFIPLSFSELDTKMDIDKAKVHYQALKVKRIQPNPRKLKRLKVK